MRRRAVLFGLCGCGVTPRLARAATPALSTTEIAPGVHVRHGLTQDATADNGDAIANLGFVIGGAAVAVLDPGGCLSDGAALRTRIAAVTDKPVRYVVLSHVHPDHVFGAAAFLPDAPSFVGHASLPQALRARGEFYRAGLAAMLGPDAAGSVVMPDRLVTDIDHIDLGDRLLELRAHQVAHTDCDLSVHDISTGTWFAGDLLFVDRVASLDGSLRGWIAELEAARARPASAVVPGHGPVQAAWPDAAVPLLRYLTALRRDVAALIARGGRIEDAPDTVREERSRWALFDDYHGRNATEAYKELEWE